MMSPILSTSGWQQTPDFNSGVFFSKSCCRSPALKLVETKKKQRKVIMVMQSPLPPHPLALVRQIFWHLKPGAAPSLSLQLKSSKTPHKSIFLQRHGYTSLKPVGTCIRDCGRLTYWTRAHPLASSRSVTFLASRPSWRHPAISVRKSMQMSIWEKVNTANSVNRKQYENRPACWSPRWNFATELTCFVW